MPARRLQPREGAKLWPPCRLHYRICLTPAYSPAAAGLLNVFMTFAWYGHLKYRSVALPKVILISWGIAFFEYLLMVPANRMGSTVYSAPQLKGLQEVITLLVFAGFSTLYLGQALKWNHWAGLV